MVCLLLAANISCNRARAHVSTAKGHAEPTLALLAFQAPRPRQEAGPDPVVCLLHDLRSRARRQQPGAAPHNMSALCCGPLCTGCRPAACCVAPGSLRCRSAALLPCTRCRCCTPRRRRRRRRRPAAPPRPPRVGRDILLVGMNCGLGAGGDLSRGRGSSAVFCFSSSFVLGPVPEYFATGHNYFPLGLGAVTLT